MEYGEKLRYVRFEILHMTQKQLGDVLDVNQSYIAILESGTKNKRLSREKEAKLIKIASLPIGFFDGETEINEVINNVNDKFYALVPEAKVIGLTLDQVRDMIKVISRTHLK